MRVFFYNQDNSEIIYCIRNMAGRETMQTQESVETNKVSSQDINNVNIFFDKILQWEKENQDKDLREITKLIESTANKNRPQLLEDLQTLIDSEYEKALEWPVEQEANLSWVAIKKIDKVKKRTLEQNEKIQKKYNNLDEWHIDDVKEAYDKAIEKAQEKAQENINLESITVAVKKNSEEKTETWETEAWTTESIDVTTHEPNNFEEFTDNFDKLDWRWEKEMYAVRLFSDPNMGAIYDDMIASCMDQEEEIYEDDWDGTKEKKKVWVTPVIWDIVQSYLATCKITQSEDITGKKPDIPKFTSLDQVSVWTETIGGEDQKVIYIGSEDFIYFDADSQEDEIYKKNYEETNKQAEDEMNKAMKTTWKSLSWRKWHFASWIKAISDWNFDDAFTSFSWILNTFTQYLRSDEGSILNKLLSQTSLLSYINTFNDLFPPSDTEIETLKESQTNDRTDDEKKLLDEDGVNNSNSHKAILMSMSSQQRKVLLEENNLYPEKRLLRNNFLQNPNTTIPQVLDKNNYIEVTKSDADKEKDNDQPEKKEEDTEESKEKTENIGGTDYTYKTESFGSWEDKVTYISSNWEKTEDKKVTKYTLPLFWDKQIIKKEDNSFVSINITKDDKQNKLITEEQNIENSSHLNNVTGDIIDADLNTELTGKDEKQKKEILEYVLFSSPEVGERLWKLNPTEYNEVIPLMNTLYSQLFDEDAKLYSQDRPINNNDFTKTHNDIKNIEKDADEIATTEEYNYEWNLEQWK